MHAEAMAWIAGHAPPGPVTVLDLGGRDINGSPRGLFDATSYTVLDARDGPGVDVVADAAAWDPAGREWDVVVCAETFEHTPAWRAIIRTAYKACKPGGLFIVTTAAPGRAPHSGVDGGGVLYEGEHYANIRPPELERALKQAGWDQVVIDVREFPADVRAVAVKP